MENDCRYWMNCARQIAATADNKSISSSSQGAGSGGKERDVAPMFNRIITHQDTNE